MFAINYRLHWPLALGALFLAVAADSILASEAEETSRFAVLEPSDYKRHADYFNGFDEEAVVNLVPNAQSWEWMRESIPFFECSDADLEEIYYFRWWALRKHLKKVGAHFAYTEFIELHTTASFIPPERTIASALGHHFMETRWLVDQSKDDSYLDYWFVGKDGGYQDHFHRYSSWLYDALWERYLVTKDREFIEERFERFQSDYRLWKTNRQREDGLYWQYDVWDAMEESISGGRHEKNARPTINSYMYGNAVALAKMAKLLGQDGVAASYGKEAETLRSKAVKGLWNEESSFFEVVKEDGSFANAREAIGFIPWYFEMPPAGRGYEKAWEQLVDLEGFWAPRGLTTAERRHPEFRSHGVGTCEWDGAVWPYATSQTLNALANVLRGYEQDAVTEDDFFAAFLTYTRSHRYGDIPYIGEYHDEVTGQWLKGPNPRSKFYHHSTYADLLIAQLIGIRAEDTERVVVDPLIPDDVWDWFCLDGVPYRGHVLTVFWDKDGSRYGRGAGFRLLIDGVESAFADGIERLEGDLR